MLPEGLHYLDSWIVSDQALDRCFQLMETEDPQLLAEWIGRWKDLCEFEILPVIDSTEAATRVGITWGVRGL